MEDPYVSLVFPAHNEEGYLRDAIETVTETVSAFMDKDRFDIIVAEHASTDETGDIADRIASERENVRHVPVSGPGKGRGITEGFRAADGDILVFMDVDMSTDPRHIEELIDSVAQDGYDIAIGSRLVSGAAVDRSATRTILSRGYNLLVRLVLQSDIHDHQCGFKAFHHDAFTSLAGHVSSDGWFWDTDILIEAQRHGYRIRELPVTWQSRGDTNLGPVDILRLGIEVFRKRWKVSIHPQR